MINFYIDPYSQNIFGKNIKERGQNSSLGRGVLALSFLFSIGNNVKQYKANIFFAKK